MFEQLPETISDKPGQMRSNLFLMYTTFVYSFVLLVVGVASVFWLNPSLADTFSVSTILAPPVPPAYTPPAPQQPQVFVKAEQPTTFTPPEKPPEKIPDATTVLSRPVISQVSTGVPGAPSGENGVPGLPAATSVGDPSPPPPPPRPSPTTAPTIAPTPPPKQISISGGVLQGKAIAKVQPQYPPIAKAARASGSVQVQVLISEEGRVIDAQVLSGHPLLREAAMQAARQWKFTPTELTGVPVKVQGVLTFNFTLQ